MTEQNLRVLLLCTHPVQYCSPMWRLIALRPGLEISIRPVNAREVRGQFRRSLLTSWSECKVLRQENIATFNPGETFFQRQELCYFLPLFGVAEIGEIKPPTPNVLQSGKARFE